MFNEEPCTDVVGLQVRREYTTKQSLFYIGKNYFIKFSAKFDIFSHIFLFPTGESSNLDEFLLIFA